MEDKGDTVPGFDNVNNRFEAYTSWFRASMGLVPEDWRQSVRIANLDVTNAGLAGPTAPDLWALMAKAALAVKKGKADAYYDAKLAVGRHYIERVLPETGAHLAKLKTGAGTLMALPAEAF